MTTLSRNCFWWRAAVSCFPIFPRFPATAYREFLLSRVIEHDLLNVSLSREPKKREMSVPFSICGYVTSPVAVFPYVLQFGHFFGRPRGGRLGVGLRKITKLQVVQRFFFLFCFGPETPTNQRESSACCPCTPVKKRKLLSPQQQNAKLRRITHREAVARFSSVTSIHLTLPSGRSRKVLTQVDTGDTLQMA